MFVLYEKLLGIIRIGFEFLKNCWNSEKIKLFYNNHSKLIKCILLVFIGILIGLLLYYVFARQQIKTPIQLNLSAKDTTQISPIQQSVAPTLETDHRKIPIYHININNKDGQIIFIVSK